MTTVKKMWKRMGPALILLAGLALPATSLAQAAGQGSTGLDPEPPSRGSGSGAVEIDPAKVKAEVERLINENPKKYKTEKKKQELEKQVRKRMENEAKKAAKRKAGEEKRNPRTKGNAGEEGEQPEAGGGKGGKEDAAGGGKEGKEGAAGVGPGDGESPQGRRGRGKTGEKGNAPPKGPLSAGAEAGGGPPKGKPGVEGGGTGDEVPKPAGAGAEGGAGKPGLVGEGENPDPGLRRRRPPQPGAGKAQPKSAPATGGGKGGKGGEEDDDQSLIGRMKPPTPPAAGGGNAATPSDLEKALKGENKGGDPATPGPQPTGGGEAGGLIGSLKGFFGGGNAATIVWSNSLAEAKGAALSSGKPVFIYMFRPGAEACTVLDQTTLRDAKVVRQVAATFVPVRVDVEATPSVAQEFKVDTVPIFVILGSKGDEWGRISGILDPESFLGQLKKYAGKAGNGPELSLSEQAQKLLGDGEAAMTAEKYATALAAYRTILAQHANSAEAIIARDKTSQIERLAGERLDEMKRMAQVRNFDQLTKLKTELQDKFQGTTAAGKAGELYASLMASDETRLALRTAAAKREITSILGDLKAERIASGYDRLAKFIKDYRDLPDLAAEARQHLALLQNNPILMRKARDEVAASQCKLWLSLARSWKKNQRAPKAKEYYAKIIENFPGTSFAEIAAEEMQDLFSSARRPN